jgi:CheY-like chemotaxis protein
MKRVLIVDDSLELGRVLQALVSALDPGISTTVVPSAEEALLATARYPLDLLVADIRLPGMSGFDLVKKIRGRVPAVKVILITGLKEETYTRQAREFKVDGFFRKPLALPEFQEVVRQCLGMEAAPAPAPVQPPAPAPVQTPPPEPGELRERLPDILTNLRHNLGALTVLLLDDSGRIMAQAGELPEASFDSEWVPPIMVATSANAKVINLVGGPLSENVQAFHGKNFDVVLVGIEDYALVIILRTGKTVLRLALAFEEAFAVQKDLVLLLGSRLRRKSMEQENYRVQIPVLGVSMPAQGLSNLQNEPEVEELTALLEKNARKPKRAEADAFWDSMAELKPPLSANPEEISYEQAHKLGIAPPDLPS